MLAHGKEVNVIAKKYKAREKIRQKMSNSGLVEENLTTGESKRLSKKEEELNFTKKTAEKNPELKSQRKKNPRFQFSEEDLANQKLEKQIGKVQKAEEKLDKAYEKIPKKKKLLREKTYDEVKGKKKTKIRFEEVDKKPNHRQKFQQPVERMTSSAENVLHGKIYEVEKENVGVEAGHTGERTAEAAVRHSARKINSAYREHRLKPFINAEKAERALEKETIKFRYMEFHTGRYQENLTVEQAIEAYRQIDQARGVKGIGVHMEDHEWGLVNGKELNLEDLKFVPQVASNLQVQEGIKTIYQNMPELSVVGKEEYLKNAEILLEDDYGMIDGIINNGPKEETQKEKPSIIAEIKAAQKEVAEKKPELKEKSHNKSHGQEL